VNNIIHHRRLQSQVSTKALLFLLTVHIRTCPVKRWAQKLIEKRLTRYSVFLCSTKWSQRSLEW